MKEKQEIKKTYFQKQGVFSMKCGLHAVNNLLGKPQYNKSDFNQICNQLSALTDQSYQYPVIGGDYDVSVLIKALNKMNFQVQWHDARKQFQKDMLTPSQLQKIQGFLVNLKMPQKFYHKVFRVSGRHWVSIRLCSSNISDKKLKFDSSKQKVVQMGQDSLYQFLEDQRKKGAQILKSEVYLFAIYLLDLTQKVIKFIKSIKKDKNLQHPVKLEKLKIPLKQIQTSRKSRFTLIEKNCILQQLQVIQKIKELEILSYQPNYRNNHMDGNQLFRETFFPSNNFDENFSHKIEKRGFSKNLSYDRYHPQSNLSYSTKPIKSSKKSQKQFFSQRRATNQLKNAFESLQIQPQKRQRRYLSTIEKRNFESSFQDVSPWNSSLTPKQNTISKSNFSKQRQKIKQMIHEYRLNKTIDQNTKEHANFIKSSKSKKKKINMVLLQYNKGTNPIQRPLSLIKSVDVNKSYENYLNNELEMDEKLFKISIKIKNQHKKQIFSSRIYTKQSQKQKDRTIKQQLTQNIKEDLICSNYLDQLKANISHQDLTKENDKQKTFQNKKLQQKVLMLRNQRNKNGLRNQRQLRNCWQESRLTPKILVKQQKLDFSVSGNKTHKLQYLKTNTKID